MIDLKALYFEWLLTRIDPDGVLEGVAYVGDLLHNVEFKRRIGNDINRAAAGIDLRTEFLTQFSDVDIGPRLSNDLMAQPCSWFEMILALSTALDYMYDGGVEGRLRELITNLGLSKLLSFKSKRTADQWEQDLSLVVLVTLRVDESTFRPNGYGGLFPLRGTDHIDQRRIEIWDQHAAYFNERFEGVLWTSTS